MFDRRSDHVFSGVELFHCSTFDCPVIALCTAAREENLIRLYSQQLRNLFARLLEQRICLITYSVQTGRIAKKLFIDLSVRIQNLWIHFRCCTVVKINHLYLHFLNNFAPLAGHPIHYIENV